MQFDLASLGLTKAELMEITRAENLPITESYRPVYWQHAYQTKRVGPKAGFPFDVSLSAMNHDNYARGSCPRAERLFGETCLTFEICSYDIHEEHIDRIARMFSRIERACRDGKARG
jgi:hypothetical protein